ncbi:MAG: ComEC/Rec2 family competence protein [Spirochaetaceae bacterium]|nr:ComEC/Rec2 family competence protein [Spirochaetaceae bacterium]
MAAGLLRRLALHTEPVCAAAAGMVLARVTGQTACALGLAFVAGAAGMVCQELPRGEKGLWSGVRPDIIRKTARLGKAMALGLVLGAAIQLYLGWMHDLTEILALARQSPIVMVEGVLADDPRACSDGRSLASLELQGLEFRQVRGLCGRVRWERPVVVLPVLLGAESGLVRGMQVQLRGRMLAGMNGTSSMVFLAQRYGALEKPPFRARLRGRLLEHLGKAAGMSSGLAESLLLGVRDNLDPGYGSLFRNAGCAHLLALSGQHLSILTAVVVFLLRRLHAGKTLAGGIAVLSAWGFVWLAGPGPSLERAAIMMSVHTLAALTDRPQGGMACLACTLVLMGLFDPAQVWSLSAVYSFLSIAGLLLFSPRIAALLRPYLPQWLALGMAVSLGAMSAAAPVSLLVFGAFAPAGMLCALPAGLVMTLYMWSALAALFLTMLIPSLVCWTAPVLERLEYLLIAVLRAGASFPLLEAGENPVARAGAAGAVVLIGLLVYAVPAVQWRVWHRYGTLAGKLRLSLFDPGAARIAGAGDEQAFWAELPYRSLDA